MMTIRLQHEDVELPELCGQKCSAFCAIEDLEAGFVGPLYLQLERTWHRFYLDAGLLFWEEGIDPEPDEELLEGERCVDLGAALGACGQRLAYIRMHDSQLRIAFENGAQLVLQHGVRDGGTTVVGRISVKT